MTQPRSALAEAHTLYADPHPIARAARANGARLCGYIGSDVPEELICAAGFVPIRLRGDPTTPPPLGDRYGYLAEPVTRSLLARIADGAYAYLEALVIDRSLDAHANLFFNLRQIRLMLPEVRLPEVHFFDLLHLPHLTTARYNRDRVRELADTLVEWSGHPFGDVEMAREIQRTNQRRVMLDELDRFRTEDQPRLSGTDALALISCAMLLPAHDYADLLRRALRELASAPPVVGQRLFLTGSNHDSTRLYAAIEQAGFVIVGEDHDWGDRSYADRIDERAAWLDALTDRAMFGAPAAAKYGLAERVEYVCSRVRATRAEVLLALNRSGDDAARWEFPDIQATLHPEGVLCARVDEVPYAEDAALSSVAELLRSLKGSLP